MLDLLQKSSLPQTLAPHGWITEKLSFKSFFSKVSHGTCARGKCGRSPGTVRLKPYQGRCVAVFTYIGKRSVLFVEQILEGCKWRIIDVLAVSTILDVQVLPAFDAETLAVWIMQWFDGEFE